jgi:peptidoglycan/xylan/chitin deacetylase (PgdA/CDA1 family)
MLIWDLLRQVVRKATAKSIVLKAPRPIVSFTFDDFPRSAILNGAKILERHGARGTFYGAGSYCDQSVEGVVQYSAQDLPQLVRSGHEIGCHTFNHRRVSTLSKNALLAEIELNRTFFARHLPALKMKTFAYPFGDQSLSATLRLQRIFDACRSTDSGLNAGRIDLGRLRANRLYNSVIDVRKVGELIHEAAASNAWLIFYTHDVDPTPTRFGCTPRLFEEAVKMAASSGARLLPVGEAINEPAIAPMS